MKWPAVRSGARTDSHQVRVAESQIGIRSTTPPERVSFNERFLQYTQTNLACTAKLTTLTFTRRPQQQDGCKASYSVHTDTTYSKNRIGKLSIVYNNMLHTVT